ncbi:hypothetical protein [Frigoriglobus tundricola]|uniref:Uncharacterized protein n=1 Tax=Frigoriglobus tundricola TaxID=2774151 RepID=A0A6M5Z020_9BACT|nr:hypothetical protein [Frigoriglobus tundricola]QJW99545.1 hypothetical protein FTUN_7157 [Frigoriglobus tundricola]
MNDTATHPVPTLLCAPALLPTPEPNPEPVPPTRRRALYTSLTDAAARLDELEQQGRTGRLIILGQALFAVEWV